MKIISGQYTNREMMEELGIVNDSQIRIWTHKGSFYIDYYTFK